MKRSILVAALTSFFMSLSLSPVNAQILRVPCAGGNCYRSTRIVQNTRVYAPYSYRAAVERLGAAQTVAPCAPTANVEVEAIPEPTVEPCAPVEAVEPCAPVADCDNAVEYMPTDAGNICIGGTCPIRTAVKATTNAVKATAQTVAASARWLLSVNKTRARYGLAPLTGAADLDAGCETVANNCAETGTLTHGAGYEILAFNYSGIDAACGQWLNSPAHRALLLSPNFRAAGVAVVKTADGRVYCAVKFR